VARIFSNSVNLQGGLKIIMTIETMNREFRYDQLRLPDPNPRLTVDEVRTAFSATYPEIATATLTGPEAVGNKLVYHFTKAIEIRGASAFFARPGFHASRL
jgi:PRTRC genetic system protein C